MFVFVFVKEDLHSATVAFQSSVITLILDTNQFLAANHKLIFSITSHCPWNRLPVSSLQPPDIQSHSLCNTRLCDWINSLIFPHSRTVSFLAENLPVAQILSTMDFSHPPDWFYGFCDYFQTYSAHFSFSSLMSCFVRLSWLWSAFQCISNLRTSYRNDVYDAWFMCYEPSAAHYKRNKWAGGFSCSETCRGKYSVNISLSATGSAVRLASPHHLRQYVETCSRCGTGTGRQAVPLCRLHLIPEDPAPDDPYRPHQPTPLPGSSPSTTVHENCSHNRSTHYSYRTVIRLRVTIELFSCCRGHP